MEERHSSAFSLFPSFPPSLSHPYHFLGTVQDFSKLPSFTHRTTFPLCFTTETWGDTTAPKCGNWTWPSCMPDSKSAHSLSSRLATSLRGHRGQPIPNEFPLLKISENFLCLIKCQNGKGSNEGKAMKRSLKNIIKLISSILHLPHPFYKASQPICVKQKFKIQS